MVTGDGRRVPGAGRREAGNGRRSVPDLAADSLHHMSVTVIGNDAAEVLVAVAVDMVNAALLVIAEGVEPSHVVVCHALQLVSLPGEFVRQLSLVGLVAHGFPLSRHKHLGLDGGSFVNARNRITAYSSARLTSFSTIAVVTPSYVLRAKMRLLQYCVVQPVAR